MLGNARGMRGGASAARDALAPINPAGARAQARPGREGGGGRAPGGHRSQWPEALNKLREGFGWGGEQRPPPCHKIILAPPLRDPSPKICPSPHLAPSGRSWGTTPTLPLVFSFCIHSPGSPGPPIEGYRGVQRGRNCPWRSIWVLPFSMIGFLGLALRPTKIKSG